MDLLFVASGIGLVAGFLLIFLWMGRPSPESVLLAKLANQAYQSSANERETTWLDAERLAAPFARLRSLFSSEPSPGVVHQLMLAGYRKRYHADVYTGVRLILPVVAGVAVAFWVSDNIIFWFILAMAGAFFLPEFWLTRAIGKRRERIRLSLPDALDLLSICIEAGLGLDQAILRIGQELKIRHPDLSAELLQVNLEQQAGNPRIEAWRKMAARVKVDSVQSFVNMLAQTERFGTPVSKSLTTFSDGLRTQRRQQAEERAAKTTIKLAIPLVLFIFPSIFVVTVAPAIITIMESFGKFLG
ncbi:MAG: type II secretion system F family protein [Terriglobia bacterium]